MPDLNHQKTKTQITLPMPVEVGNAIYFLLLPSDQRSFPDHQRQEQDFRFRYPGGDWP